MPLFSVDYPSSDDQEKRKQALAERPKSSSTSVQTELADCFLSSWTFTVGKATHTHAASELYVECASKRVLSRTNRIAYREDGTRKIRDALAGGGALGLALSHSRKVSLRNTIYSRQARQLPMRYLRTATSESAAHERCIDWLLCADILAPGLRRDGWHAGRHLER